MASALLFLARSFATDPHDSVEPLTRGCLPTSCVSGLIRWFRTYTAGTIWHYCDERCVAPIDTARMEKRLG